eukprot:8727284-Lingulodinium_polyedra.AAC.1
MVAEGEKELSPLEKEAARLARELAEADAVVANASRAAVRRAGRVRAASVTLAANAQASVSAANA